MRNTLTTFVIHALAVRAGVDGGGSPAGGCSCAHILTCDTLNAGEAAVLACFPFGKIKNPLKSAPDFAKIYLYLYAHVQG